MVVSDNFEYNLLGLQISTYNADRLRRIIFIKYQLVQLSYIHTL